MEFLNVSFCASYITDILLFLANVICQCTMMLHLCYYSACVTYF